MFTSSLSVSSGGSNRSWRKSKDMTAEAHTDGPPRYSKADLLEQPAKTYKLPERLVWVYGLAKFTPTGETEANTAFRRIYSAAGGGTPAGDLEAVRRSRLYSPKTVDAIGAGDLSVIGAARTEVLFLHQADRDARALVDAKKDLASYPSVAMFFRDVPLRPGIGQLARYVDAMQALEDPSTISQFAFKAKADITMGRKAVVDPYTSASLFSPMARHIDTVIAGIAPQQVPELFDEAIKNEQSRWEFWSTQVQGMLLDPAARSLASEALGELRYRPEEQSS